MSTPPELTPVQVHALCAADEVAAKARTAVMDSAEKAAGAMQADLLVRARHWLTHALAELDALEERLTHLGGQR